VSAVLETFNKSQKDPKGKHSIRYDIYKLVFHKGEVQALKPDNEPFSEKEAKEIKAEISGLTKRRWAQLTKGKDDHHAHFCLVPEPSYRAGSHVSPGDSIHSATSGVNSTTILCYHREYEECEIELTKEGEHYGLPVNYGHCFDCGRCFISVKEVEKITA
jgi:hypothetical protein